MTDKFGRLLWYVTDMLPMDTKLVTLGNDVVLTSKPCHQTSAVPYSTENRSKVVLMHFMYLQWNLYIKTTFD